jgi:hypothetical protein
MILSWIAMIVCGVAAVLPSAPSAVSVIANSLCILGVAFNAYAIGRSAAS